MFIISLNYLVSLEEVDKARAEHIKYLDKYYEKSIFFASGPKVPRSGGVIVAHGISRDELEHIIREDPFWKKQIAEYEIIEFTPTKMAQFPV